MQKSVIEYLRKTVDAHPDKVAVRDAEREVTFSGLWDAARSVSNAVKAAGIDRNSPVGVYIPKGCRMVEAFAGINMCGCFYVPLDTKWLKEREEISNGYPNFTKYVKYQDADGKSLVGYINNPGVTENDGPEGGYVGDGNEYSHDERANSVWETYNESSLFMTPTVTYTARHEVQGWREEEVYLGESDITGGGTNSGYRNGDPVLIRRRN